MTRIRYVAATVALACAFAASSAWADAENTHVNSSVRDNETVSRQLTNTLLQDVAVGPYGVRVRTTNDRVLLTGSVGTVRDWMRADQDARNAASGMPVQNDLSVLIR